MKTVFSLYISMLVFFSCHKGPSDPPEVQFGSLKISAYHDTVLVDSMAVTIDDMDIGVQPNPYLSDPILAGRHLVSVAKKDPQSPIDFTSIPQKVTVIYNEITNVSFALTKIAPGFTLNNLNDHPISLENYIDRVVLLVFFTHTWPVCIQAEIPTVQIEIVEKYDSLKVVVLGLARNETTVNWLKNYVSSRRITFEILYRANEVFSLFGVFSEPTYVLIDKQGLIRFGDNNYYYNQINVLKEKIDKLILE